MPFAFRHNTLLGRHSRSLLCRYSTRPLRSDKHSTLKSPLNTTSPSLLRQTRIDRFLTAVLHMSSACPCPSTDTMHVPVFETWPCLFCLFVCFSCKHRRAVIFLIRSFSPQRSTPVHQLYSMLQLITANRNLKTCRLRSLPHDQTGTEPDRFHDYCTIVSQTTFGLLFVILHHLQLRIQPTTQKSSECQM